MRAAWETRHRDRRAAPVRGRRIAYQGEPGSNSHLLCTQPYPDWEAVACASFEDVFAAVENGAADLAMIPIDNSLAGRVADIHHFLPTSSLHIVAEHFLRIRFALMALPGATTETIKTVHSHVHALGQCRRVIREHGLQPVISGDTAGAAREVAEAGDPTQAAIAPPLAAEIYGLQILADDIEDEDHNTTRFVVLSRELTQAPRRRGPGRHVVRLQRPQPARRALQGARRLRDQRRQHDQARELHGRRPLRGDPVPRRGRRAPRRPRRPTRPRGAGLLHHRREDPRRLPRRSRVAATERHPANGHGTRWIAAWSWSVIQIHPSAAATLPLPPSVPTRAAAAPTRGSTTVTPSQVRTQT